MIHLKGFKQINESYQDGLEIMDAIRNTPEGRDLCLISGVEPGVGRELSVVFDMKKTGRIHYRPTVPFSKTFLDRDEEGYYFTSVSNGVPFGKENFLTIRELLRGLWLTLLTRSLTTAGVKKDELREWISNNINPGSQITRDEIFNRFLEYKNIGFPDLSLIPQSRAFRIINSVYGIESQQIRGGSYLDLAFNPFKLFGMIFCTEVPNAEQIKMTFHVVPKIKCKNDINNDVIQVCYSDNFLSDFDKIFTERLEYHFDRNFRGLRDNDCFNNFIRPVFYDLIAMCKNRNTDPNDFTNLKDLVSNLIEKTSKEKPEDLYKIMDFIGEIEELYDIYNKYKEEKDSLIRGGRIMRRFRI